MVIHRLLLLLFGIVPMILPLSLFSLFSFLKSSPDVSTQNEYSENILLTDLDELVARTIQIRPLEQTEGLWISSSAWVFHIADQKPKRAHKKGIAVARVGRNVMQRDEATRGVVPKHLPQDSSRVALGMTVVNIQKKVEPTDEDPFLKEWQKKKGYEYSSLSIQKRGEPPSAVERDGWRGEGGSPPQRGGRVPSPRQDPSLSKPEEMASLATGPARNGSAALLNMNLMDGGYLSYTTLDGVISVEGDNWVESFYEVSFYDRIGEKGIDDEDSTVIASQEIRDPSNLDFSGRFVLRIPAESSGILVAKGYALDDPEKKSPIYLGTYEKKPLRIPKEGISNLNITLFPHDEYLTKYLTTFIGKIYNEYHGKDSTQCISGAAVSLLELNQQSTTDEQCVFEFKGMAIGYPYHLLFEKEGFATVQIPVKLEQKKEFQTFFISPITKFTQGYDSLLGERNRDKSVLFATVYKGGKPLERAIVKAPQSEKIVYEKASDLGSFPDETLFSASSNGKFILWNVDPGKISIDVFYDGHHLGRRIARLMPGITHQLDIDF